MSSPRSFVEFAHRLADAAGAIVRRYFRRSPEVEGKADGSPVTEADRGAERAIREMIEAEYPAHGIIGEEYGATDTKAEYVWVIDPIDGTKGFLGGVPLFGTLIALLHQGRPVLGVIDQPIARERWLGAEGSATSLNGESVAVRPCPEPAQAVLYTTAPELFVATEAEAFARLRRVVNWSRYSADCYAFGLLAAGFIDLVVETKLKPYDYCALVPVVENAGGVISDWGGAPLGLESDGRVLAAGDPALHAAALALLAG